VGTDGQTPEGRVGVESDWGMVETLPVDALPVEALPVEALPVEALVVWDLFLLIR